MFYDEIKYGIREDMVGMPPGLVDWREGLYLAHVAREEYRGIGEIIDAGSFLGGSAWALSQGLRQNPLNIEKYARIHAFDRFVAWEEPAMTKAQTAKWIQQNFGAEVDEDGNFRESFIRNLGESIHTVSIHEGSLETTVWPGTPIEILFIDAGKTPEIWTRIVSQFYSALIPGTSIVIHQDWHHAWLPHLIVTQEFLSEYFEISEPRINDTASFRYKTALPTHVLNTASLRRFSADDQIALMQRAISRFEIFGADAFIRLAYVELLRSIDRKTAAIDFLKSQDPSEREFSDHCQFQRYLTSRAEIFSRLSP